MTAYVDPTRDQFSAMMKLPEEGAIHMLNMLRFNERAAYGEDDPLRAEGLSGAEAYARYGSESEPVFKRVGGRMALSWTPRHVLIGPADEVWNLIFIAEYPSAAAFGEMVKDPEYQKAVRHRQAAVAQSRLIRMKPREAGANFSA